MAISSSALDDKLTFEFGIQFLKLSMIDVGVWDSNKSEANFTSDPANRCRCTRYPARAGLLNHMALIFEQQNQILSTAASHDAIARNCGTYSTLIFNIRHTFQPGSCS